MGRISFSGNTGWNPSKKKQDPKAWVNPAAYSYRKNPDEWKQDIADLLCTEAVILDTETTGLSGDVRVIELSIVDLDGNVLFHSLFNPGTPLPEKIPELTGITDEMLLEAPSFLEKASEIVEILEGKSVIAWNADFDRQWLTRELLMVCQGPVAASLHWIDGMEMYAYASGRSKKWCKLISAKWEQSIGDNQEHRSTADCLDTLAVLRRISGLNREMDLLTGLCKVEKEKTNG